MQEVCRQGINSDQYATVCDGVVNEMHLLQHCRYTYVEMYGSLMVSTFCTQWHEGI